MMKGLVQPGSERLINPSVCSPSISTVTRCTSNLQLPQSPLSGEGNKTGPLSTQAPSALSEISLRRWGRLSIAAWTLSLPRCLSAAGPADTISPTARKPTPGTNVTSVSLLQKGSAIPSRPLTPGTANSSQTNRESPITTVQQPLNPSRGDEVKSKMDREDLEGSKAAHARTKGYSTLDKAGLLLLKSPSTPNIFAFIYF